MFPFIAQIHKIANLNHVEVYENYKQTVRNWKDSELHNTANLIARDH